MSGLSYRVPSFAVVLDTSAVLGYAARRLGVVDLVHSLDGDRFVVPITCMVRATRIAPSYAPGPRMLDVQRIADHPWCVLAPDPIDVGDAMATGLGYWDRLDQAAAYVIAMHLGVLVATYEPDSYLVDGKLPERVLPLEDGWVE